MRCKKSIFRTIGIFSLIIVFSVAFSALGATKRDSGGEERRITDLSVNESSDSIDLLIKGNRLLTYTSFKQPIPLTLILYFSGTVLDVPITNFSPKSDVVRTINASQVIENKYTSKIEITLKQDIQHVITRNENTLRVSFAKMPAKSDAGARIEAERSVSGSAMPVEASDTATRLQSVYAARLEDSLKVFIGADGVITNYKSFVIESPARIIFDIFNIKSPYENEKLIPVNTKWVKRVRYYGYPDRLRVVLDTRREYLTAFTASPIENGLLIHVGTDTTFETGLASRSVTDTEKPATEGTSLQSVYTTQLADSVLVTVKADGPITEYKPSTTKNPPTITLDIYGVRNPYEREKSFPVDAKWVKRVRQKTFDDKMQIIIDTYEQYLSDYTTYPEQNGLVVRIGKKSAEISATDDSMGADTPKQSYDMSKPAWINRIDFLSEDAGKSALVIGTTRQVDYDMIKESDKSLRLKVFGARIPRYRQRPLITDRFESAIDRIVPVHKPAMKDTSLFEIDMREAVPYFVEQSDNILTVHFEASSISPKPMVSAELPSWKNVLGEDAAAGSTEIATGPSDDLPGSVSEPSLTEAPTELALAEPADLGSGLSESELTEPSSGLGDSWRSGEKKRYTGEKIALDFYKTDIKNVFRILREVSGKNFAIEADVTGEVTLTLDKPVPWDQVLDLILKMNKLGMAQEGDIIRIATRKTLDKEDEEKRAAEAERLELERKISEAQVVLAPLKTVYIPVSYSDASKEIMPHIEKILTAERGSITVDGRTNTVILTDTEETIKKARELVEKLDRVTPQVLIEARIVEATANFSRNLGIGWNFAAGIPGFAGNAGVNANDGVETWAGGSGPQRGYDVLGGTYGYEMAVNLPKASKGQFAFNFLRLAGSPLTLAATIAAEESNGNVKTISTPKIVTLDNKKATISQGFSYPYQRIVDGTVSELEKEVSLSLDVTPHVTPDNRITLKMVISKEDTGSLINGRMTFLKKAANTELLVNDGETVVIGGVLQIVENDGVESIPGLSKIPLLGWLFKNKSTEDRKEELLIFITPKIVQLEQKLAF